MSREAGRAGQQYIESSFIVLVLIVVLEWVIPVLVHRTMDWGQFVFAVVFGVLVILAHVAVAYLRPASRAEIVAQVQEVLDDEQQRRTAAGMPKVHEPISPPLPIAPTWQTGDTWRPTVPGLPAVRPPPQRPR